MSLQEKTPIDAPVSALGISESEENTFANWLIALAEGKTLPEFPSCGDNLKNALQKLAADVTKRDEDDFVRTVGFSAHASEAMTSVAKLTSAVRDVDYRANNMAAAIEELSAGTDQISESARHTNELMTTARSQASEGAEASDALDVAVSEASSRMTALQENTIELSTAAQSIRGFVETVNAIAKQTNLLALNATIEAARAGEAGRGFAVVANEVKSLSSETQNATEEIRGKIEQVLNNIKNVSEDSEKALSAVNECVTHSSTTRHTVQDISDQVSQGQYAISEVSSTLEEQAAATATLAEGIADIAQNSAKSAELSQDVITNVRNSEKLIDEQFAELDKREVKDYVLQRAKSDHLLWKKRLAELIVGLESLSSSELADHHNCRLGKWYNNVTDQALLSHPAFKKILNPHAAIHKHGIAVAKAVEDGNDDIVETEFTKLEEASVDVLNYLDELLAR